MHFLGAIASGTDAEAFVLPAAFRPESTVYVKVDLCNAHNGRLEIDPSDDTFVQAEGSFSDAQCFTSLDGATFALAPDMYKQLKLKHGWNPYGFGTADPAVKNIDGIVHFTGAMGTKKTMGKRSICRRNSGPRAACISPSTCATPPMGG